MTDEEFLNKFSNKETLTADELKDLISKCNDDGIFKVADRLYKISITNCFNSDDLDYCVCTIYRLKERDGYCD